jgi:hypothetical protein
MTNACHSWKFEAARLSARLTNVQGAYRPAMWMCILKLGAYMILPHNYVSNKHKSQNNKNESVPNIGERESKHKHTVEATHV